MDLERGSWRRRATREKGTMVMRKRSGFTLIELLVVIGIIAVLAAILFPVFAHVRDKARQTACLSNEKQLGTAVLMYLQDNDERLFFYASSSVPSQSRTGAIVPAAAIDPIRWWNVLAPYSKNKGILVCPSDELPTPSKDPTGAKTILRSYIACRSAEGLVLSQLPDPAETIVITEKWGVDPTGTPITDSWIEPFNGDFNLIAGTNRMTLAGNRHGEGVNCVLFDGHAKRYSPDTILSSQDLTGCNLIHQYPVITGGAKDMCEQSTAGCQNMSPANVCNGFTYPAGG